MASLARILRALPVNVCTRRVGGVRFVKIGRLTFSFCISAEYRPIGGRV